MATQTTKSEPASRPRAEIQAELDAARTELQGMRTRCEADERKRVLMNDAIERAKEDWRKFHIGMPFDPSAYNPPMVPHKLDAALHNRHHRQHYVVARLEAELEAADRAE